MKRQPRTRINNQIRAREVRVIDEEEGNLGVLSVEAAFKKAQEKGVDLIEISPGATPPVAKIMDYGRYKYEEKKKQRDTQGRQSAETKTLQVKIGTGEQALEMKAKKASEFLEDGHRVKIDLFLAGRAKYLDKTFLNERLERILHLIAADYKIADGPKKSPKGLTVILERGGK